MSFVFSRAIFMVSMVSAIWLALLLIIGLPACAEDEISGELAKMFEQDQHDRMELPPHASSEQWKAVGEHDKAHYARVIELMNQNKLQSGDDYYFAAMIMQHGATAKDYMLAHILSMVAAQRGNKAAVWLSAASFDRLMESAGQPQVFGTQFFSEKDQPYKMREPLATDLIPDSVRKAFNVPSIAEANDRLLKKLNGTDSSQK